MIILSYQGPSFTDVRAVKLVGGLDVDEYISGLPEASCAIMLSSADDVKLPWPVTAKLYLALCDNRSEKAKQFPTQIEAQDALYALAVRVAKVIDTMPKSEAGGTAKDDEKAPRAAGSSPPKPAKEKPPKLEDKWSKMTVDELAAAAKKKGYKEEPAPNGGVRVMRLRNWLRKNVK
jgi:hypothetical protein